MQNLNKQLKNKIINRIITLEKVQCGYQVFFPIIHIDDRNSLIISPYLSFEVEDTSKVLLIDDCGKKLFFQYRDFIVELNRFTSERISEVLKVEILGDSGVKNLMDMFLANEALIKDGDITLRGLNTLDIIKQNCDKILMWDSII